MSSQLKSTRLRKYSTLFNNYKSIYTHPQRFYLSTLHSKHHSFHNIHTLTQIYLSHSHVHNYSFITTTTNNNISYNPFLNNLYLYSTTYDPQSKDYYAILGVDTQCSTDDIKKAYRKLALQYHPDRNQNDKKNAEEKFKNISVAYQTLSDKNKRNEYDMLHSTASSSYARNRGVGGAKHGTYQGMSFHSDFNAFSRADADRIFNEQFNGKNPFEVMQELEQMINSFAQTQKKMDNTFGSKYKMPNMGNMKAPKFGDINWRDEISEREIEELLGKHMNENKTENSTTTTTTTTTKDGTHTTTTTTTSYWSTNNIKTKWNERVKRAEIKAKAKMKEMQNNQNPPKPAIKPSFFSQFSSKNSGINNNDINALLRQMNRGDVKDDNWNGPIIKGFDYKSLNEFVDEMMIFQENEFEKKLQIEAKQAKERGIIAFGKEKLKQNAERILFNFTHKMRGIIARGMLRKMKQEEDKYNK